MRVHIGLVVLANERRLALVEALFERSTFDISLNKKCLPFFDGTYKSFNILTALRVRKREN